MQRKDRDKIGKEVDELKHSVRLLDVERTGQWLMPLSLTLGSLVNYIFYYLGFCFVETKVRSVGFILSYVIFSAVCFAVTLPVLWRERRTHRKQTLWLVAVPVLFAVFFLESFFRLGLQTVAIPYMGRFCLMAMPAFCAGVYAAWDQTDSTFIEKLEQLSFVMLPGSIIYANGALFDCNPNNYGRDLGIIGYMSVADATMPFLLALILRFLEGGELLLPIVKRPARHPQMVRGLMIVVFWLAIVATGTRGIYFSVLAVCCLIILFQLLHRESVRRSAAMLVIMLVILGVCISPISPSGMRWAGRLNIFLDGLKSGEIVTTIENTKDIDSHLDELVDSDHIGKDPGTEPAAPSDTEDPAETLEQVNGEVASRGTIWKIAIKEFLKHPVFGMAPFGHLVKYGRYPHNVVLELFCETGIVGAVPLLALILLAVVRILKAEKNRRAARYAFLLFAAFAVRAMCSGSLWECFPLLGALGYGLAVPSARSEKETK